MLQTGDLILSTGLNSSSKLLVAAQRTIIPEARSSHVMIAHAETLIIDAMPKKGVQHSFVLNALQNIEPQWVVIRRIGLTENDRETIIKAATYFLWQSYLIHPNAIIGKKRSYCSELARKIYEKAGIDLGVQPQGVIMPAHFDSLATSSSLWANVTDEIADWLVTIRNDEGYFRSQSDTMIDGIKLNRKRFCDREKMLKLLVKKERKGVISKEKLAECIKILNQADEDVEFKFWDT
jgi:hypothetical protein